MSSAEGNGPEAPVMTILETARSAYAAGLCLLPTRNDGSKAPDVLRWTDFQTTRPAREQMRAFRFAERSGLGVIAGAVSGRRECWDFDTEDVFQAFVTEATACGLRDVVDRLTTGYLDVTPGGGRRIIVTYPAEVEWHDVTLARRPGRGDEPKIKTLIELPTFAIIAPSNGKTHPSGRPYVRVSGGVDTIASYTADERERMMALARSFDELPRHEAARVRGGSSTTGDRPGDDFNRRMTWPGLLEPAGWTRIYDRGEAVCWCRPGKTHGISATTNFGGSDLLYVFTSSTAFDPEASYSKFGAYAVLQHGGDFAAAARALVRDGFAGSRTAPGVHALGASNGAVGNGEPWRDDAGSGTQPMVTCLANVVPEDVTWIWPGRLASGKLNLLVGDPGLGKSFVTLDVVARYTTGQAWPDGAPGGPIGNAILLSAEDGLADTIRPRLDALGGNPALVHHIATVREGRDVRGIQLADVAALDVAIRRTSARLLVIDPVSAYVGDKDSHRDAEVRGLLAPLAQLAELHHVTIVGVMHLSKNSQRAAIYRTIGSIAFVGAARVALAVAADPELDERRLLAPLKSNLSAAPPVLAFSIPDGRLVWEPEAVVGIDINDVLRGPAGDRDERRESDDWLRDLLSDGPVLVKAIEREAREAGMSKSTVERAKARIHARAVKNGNAGPWSWELPSKAVTWIGRPSPENDGLRGIPRDSSKAVKSDSLTAFERSAPDTPPLGTQPTTSAGAPDGLFPATSGAIDGPLPPVTDTGEAFDL